MGLFEISAILIVLTALFSFVNYRTIRLPTTRGMLKKSDTNVTNSKTDDRPRRIPITTKLEQLFQEVLKQTGPEYEYLFSMKDGSRFNPDNFREAAWKTAFRKSSLEYMAEVRQTLCAPRNLVIELSIQEVCLSAVTYQYKK